ncbi:MAG: BON domain-containing protein [Opitutaceae bacterium]|nr:BON domain-containing protein [Opitutaceae bacterium]
MSAAIAVRQAIDRDQSIQGSVQVIPESRIVLQGSVPSEQKKNEIEQAARQAAPGVRIDSNLTVRQW